MADQIFHGSRALVVFGSKPIGLFTSLSFGLAYDHNEAYVLGRYTPVEITLTGVNAVRITCSGWRSVGNSAFDSNSIQMLPIQQLLDSGTTTDFAMVVLDRTTDKVIAKVTGCKVVSFSNTINAKQATELSVEIVGLMFSGDEVVENMSEPRNAAVFPAS